MGKFILNNVCPESEQYRLVVFLTLTSSLASSISDQVWKHIYSAFKTFTILDMGLGNDFFFFFFLDMIPKAQNNKSKNKQVGLHQTEKLLHNKAINEWSQPTQWEKIFANYISNKG